MSQAQPRTPPTMLAHLVDLANLVTLTGLLLAVVAAYCVITQQPKAALIAILWAILVDYLDGPIARRAQGRAQHLAEFGCSLDYLVDIVSCGVCPALIVLTYGRSYPWLIPVAALLTVATVVRHSYFNVWVPTRYEKRGLSLDSNVFALALLFAFEPLLGQTAFAIALGALGVVLAALNVGSFRLPAAPHYIWLGVATYVAALTAVLGHTHR